MKLHITKEFTIWCDRCQHWEQQGERTKRVFEKRMRTQGWCSRGAETVCKLCACELDEGRAMNDIGYRRAEY